MSRHLPSNSTQRRKLLERLAAVQRVVDLAAPEVAVVSVSASSLAVSALNETNYGPWAALVLSVVSGLTYANMDKVLSVISRLVKIMRPVANNSPTVAPSLSPVPSCGKVGVDAKKPWSSRWIIAGIATGMLFVRDFTATLPWSESITQRKKRMMNAHVAEVFALGENTIMVEQVCDEAQRLHLLENTYRPRRWGVSLLLLLVAIHFLKVMWKRSSSPIGAVWTTKFISSTLSAGNLSSSQQRQVFVATPLSRSKPQSNHTHGNSAADRNAGSATCALVANSLGLEPYFIQQSLADLRKARKGDRSFHWPKDIAIPPSEFAFDSTKQAAILIDVDYYIDMPTLLARHPGTYLVAAFQPTAVAKSEGEYTFRFLDDGRVRYEVSGGATYEHLVWDYAGDTFLVEDVGLVSKTICAYHIDRKHVDAHHAIILLSLIGKFDCPAILPTSWVLEGKPLGRLSPIADGHVVMDIVTAEGRFRSIAVIGDHNAVTLPKAQFDAVRAVALIAKTMVTASTVASNIMPSAPSGLPTERLPPGHAAILTSYLRSVIPHSPPVVFPPSEALLPIHFGKYDYEAPVPLKAFGSPLIGPCYAYAASITSDDRCIQGRVEQFQATTEAELEPPLPPSLAGYMAEFAEFLIPNPHEGEPVDEDYIREKKTRANQRHLLEQATVTGDNVEAKWSAFVKKETGVKPSDPRNISSGEPKTDLDYAAYMYAFHNEVMKRQEWYAFARTPKECAERIAEVLKDAAHAVCADGSRFDAHVKRYARILERICFLRFFKPGYHARANEVLDTQIGLSGTTTEGRKYQSGYSRGSGSMETSDFNSVLTSFIDYCAWRNTTIDGIKCSPALAWSKLGIYGGDDSLAGAVDPDALKRSSELMGQDYEVIVIPRGEVGVEFLNRQFGPEIWNGDVNSMANPSRLLSKLWTGPAVLHNPLQRFAERASGYYRMDGNSPVIGPITSVAHALLGERLEGVLMPWDGKLAKESNWPNEDNGWMNDCFNRFIPDFDHDRFNTWIESVFVSGDASQLLCAPLCTPQTSDLPLPKLSCVVGDVLHIIPPKEEVKFSSSNGSEKDFALTKSEAIAFTEESTTTASSTTSGQATKPETIQDSLPAWVLEDMSPVKQHEAVVSAAKADALVPYVGLKGKRAQRSGVGTRDATEATSGKPASKAKGKGKSKDSPKGKTDPREWTEPKKGSDESKADFDSRLAKWKATRASVAKRLKIQL